MATINRFFAQFENKRIFGETPEAILIEAQREAPGEEPTEFKQLVDGTFQPFSFDPNIPTPTPVTALPPEVQPEVTGQVVETPPVILDEQAAEIDMRQFLQQFTIERAEQITSLQDLIIKSQQALPELVAPPSVLANYQALVKEGNLENIRSRQLTVSSEIDQIKLAARKEISGLPAKRIGASAAFVRGEKADIIEQTNLRLQTLILEEQSLNAQIKSKEDTITVIMELTQQDFENSRQFVEDQSKRNKDLIDSFEKIIDKDFEAKEKALALLTTERKFQFEIDKDIRNNAKSLWKTMFDTISTKGIKLRDLGEDTIRQFAALEIASGVQLGLSLKILDSIDIEEKILHWSSDDFGNSYAFVAVPGGTPRILTFPGTARTGGITPVNVIITPIVDPITGQPDIIQTINRATGEITYKSAKTGEPIDPEDVQVKLPVSEFDLYMEGIFKELNIEGIGLSAE